MKLLDCEAIAAMLLLNVAYVRDVLTKTQGFPTAYRLRGALRWREDEIAEWLESRRLSQASRRLKPPPRGSKPSTTKGRGARSSERVQGG